MRACSGSAARLPGIDDTITLNTSYKWNYGQDVVNTIVHEISEGAIGRVGGLGDQNGVWSTMDLFRFNSSGQHDYTDGRDGKTTYFSANGGTTRSLPFNNQYSGNAHVNGGDTADLAQLDVFGFGSPGETNTFSQTDLQIMNALGWNNNNTTVVHVNPTVTVKNFSVMERQSVSEAAFFTGMNNPSKDNITAYAFWDGGVGNGRITVNGIAQADGQWITVSAQQLSAVGYIGGARPGSESLYVDAYDATTGNWTAYASLTATTALAGRGTFAAGAFGWGGTGAQDITQLIHAMAGFGPSGSAQTTTPTPPDPHSNALHLTTPH